MLIDIVKTLLYVIAAIVAICIVFLAHNAIMYQRIVIPFAEINDEIAMTAVRRRELRGKNYIVCKWEAITGYNYQLIRDENGRRTNKLCLITGSSPESEIIYDLLISNNTYVLYVVEKKPYHFDGEIGVEYVVDGWDVLYPVKRDSLFNISPKYVFKGELSQTGTDAE